MKRNIQHKMKQESKLYRISQLLSHFREQVSVSIGYNAVIKKGDK